MSRALLAGVCTAALGAGGCTDGFVCTTSIEPAVIVEIRDAVDGAPLAAAATGSVRDGAYTDSLRAYGGTGDGVLLSRAAADERPGTYAVEVAHPGRVTWQRTDVRVTQDACHVATVRLVAELDRAP